MGRMQHHAIIITGSDQKDLEKIQAKALELFSKIQKDGSILKSGNVGIVGVIQQSAMNNYYSLFIAPDGSKEGWEISEEGDNARKQLMDWLQEENALDDDDRIFVDFVELTYGGDDDYQSITRSSNL